MPNSFMKMSTSESDPSIGQHCNLSLSVGSVCSSITSENKLCEYNETLMSIETSKHAILECKKVKNVLDKIIKELGIDYSTPQPITAPSVILLDNLWLATTVVNSAHSAICAAWNITIV